MQSWREMDSIIIIYDVYKVFLTSYPACQCSGPLPHLLAIFGTFPAPVSNFKTTQLPELCWLPLFSHQEGCCREQQQNIEIWSLLSHIFLEVQTKNINLLNFKLRYSFSQPASPLQTIALLHLFYCVLTLVPNHFFGPIMIEWSCKAQDR